LPESDRFAALDSAERLPRQPQPPILNLRLPICATEDSVVTYSTPAQETGPKGDIMYGMVNRAIQELIISAHGQPVWDRVRAKAGIKEIAFVAMQAYPDEVTYSLVGAICAELEAPAEVVLESFGETWVAYASSQGYSTMLDFFGKDMRSLLRNLDALHTRLKTVFPHLQPPELGCEILDDNRYRLHYRSHRPGLTHFVVGLLRGMGKRFATPVTITIEQRKEDGADHDTFLIDFLPVTT